MTCRVLNVRRQGYYEWRSGTKSARTMENELLLKHIERIHEESDDQGIRFHLGQLSQV